MSFIKYGKKEFVEFSMREDGVTLYDLAEFLLYSEYSLADVRNFFPKHLHIMSYDIIAFVRFMYFKKRAIKTKEEIDFFKKRFLSLSQEFSMHQKYLLFTNRYFYLDFPELFQEVCEKFILDSEKRRTYTFSIVNAVNIPEVLLEKVIDKPIAEIQILSTENEIKLFCEYFLKKNRLDLFYFSKDVFLDDFIRGLNRIYRYNLNQKEFNHLVSTKDFEYYNIKNTEQESLLIPIYFLENLENYFKFIAKHRSFSEVKEFHQELKEFSPMIDSFLNKVSFIK